MTNGLNQRILLDVIAVLHQVQRFPDTPIAAAICVDATVFIVVCCFRTETAARWGGLVLQLSSVGTVGLAAMRMRKQFGMPPSARR